MKASEFDKNFDNSENLLADLDLARGRRPGGGGARRAAGTAREQQVVRRDGSGAGALWRAAERSCL